MSSFNLPNLSGWKLRKIHEEIVGGKKPLKFQILIANMDFLIRRNKYVSV